MTLREELHEAVERVVHARDTAEETRQEIAALEQQHRALYEARTRALKVERAAVADAKAKRLILYHLAVKDGEWSPGETVFGLAVERHQSFRYEDKTVLDWLVSRLIAGDELAWSWARTALDKHRPALETLLRGLDPGDRPIGVQVVPEPRVKIAQGLRLEGAVVRTLEDDANAADAAADAIADVAHQVAGA